jgi:hypothetical protein
MAYAHLTFLSDDLSLHRGAHIFIYSVMIWALAFGGHILAILYGPVKTEGVYVIWDIYPTLNKRLYEAGNGETMSIWGSYDLQEINVLAIGTRFESLREVVQARWDQQDRTAQRYYISQSIYAGSQQWTA